MKGDIMKRTGFVALVFVLMAVAGCFAEQKTLPIDDFECSISGGQSGTVDFGSGNGSSVEVVAANDIIHSGKQSIKVTYDAVPDGYIYVARGADLDAANAGWLKKPEEIAWEQYGAISFYMYGTDSKTDIAFDVKDSGNEMWRFMVKDDFKGWKKVVAAFDQFIVRDDWQPQNADKNAKLDFPIKSFQFEPRPPSKGTLYFDEVVLVEK